MKKGKEKTFYGHCISCCGGSFNFGLILLIIGLFFLARDLGWIPDGLSFWAIFLVILGLYFIFSRKRIARLS